MIRTNYNALGNYTFDTKSRVYEGVSKTSAGQSFGNICTRENDVAVILTLSNQNNQSSAVELNASRTVAAKSTTSSSVLKMGSKGAKVKELQKNLTTLGYGTNGIDGKFGKGTKSAVIAFQKAYGLTTDGIVGAATQSAIAKALSNHNKGIYTVGSRGENVKKLQKYLSTLGFNTNGIDGIFGSGTKSAVIAFQNAYGLTPNGIIGEATQNAITKTLKNFNKGFLSKGIKNSRVKELQKNLKKLGYKIGVLSGVFDNTTRKAVIAFQKAHGLKKDGIAGSAVQNAITKALKAKKIVTDKKAYKKINGGNVMTLPKPGEIIEVSLGTDKKSQKAKVSKTNAWSVEYSIAGCRKAYPGKKCTERLNYALSNYKYNEGKEELLQFTINNMKCFAGAMIDSFGKIGDVAEITLDNGTKFNFLILDVKSNNHDSKQLQDNSNSKNPQCQNKYGHGYLENGGKTVQLSVCEFIVSKSNGKGSAKDYTNGKFLASRYVKKAKIIGHIPIDENL